MPVEIKSLAGLSTEILTAVFNEAFADYLLPFHLSQEQLQTKMISENIQLNNSAAVFDGSSLVGFILSGIDQVDGKPVAYNAGTGVIPAYRGNKFTNKMYDFLLPHLSNTGIKEHVLEVIQANAAAVKVYQQTGFSITSELLCFKGKVATAFEDKVSIRKVARPGIIPESTWNFQPAYQNSTTAINRVHQNHVFGEASIGDLPAGYIVYQPSNGRVKQFGVLKNYRGQNIGKSLFSFVQQQLGDQEISIINMNATDQESISFLQSLGLTCYLKQYEMKLKA